MKFIKTFDGSHLNAEKIDRIAVGCRTVENVRSFQVRAWCCGVFWDLSKDFDNESDAQIEFYSILRLLEQGF